MATVMIAIAFLVIGALVQVVLTAKILRAVKNTNTTVNLNAEIKPQHLAAMRRSIQKEGSGL